MTENTSSANESAPAAQPAAKNQDNASENVTKTASETTSKESQAAKKEPKQGVRDTRTNKTPEDGEQAQPESSAPVEKSAKNNNRNDGGQQQQANQQNNANNNNRTRGRRGRKTNDQQATPQAKQKPVKLNAKSVSKKAWKIFLAEVGEEGLALIGDKEGKELTKRSFRLAEIFQEEEQRRVQLSKDKPKKSNSDNNSEAKTAKKKPVRAKKAAKNVEAKPEAATENNTDAPKVDAPATETAAEKSE